MWYIHCSSSVLDAETWCKESRTFRFDFLLSAVAFLVWFRLFWNLRVSETFGPMYKMMQSMIEKLAIFFVIWTVILCMFTFVAFLLFGEVRFFYDLFDVWTMYYETALGQWDFKHYEGTNDDGEPLETLYVIG